MADLAITGGTIDGERVGIRISDGRIAALGPEVEAIAGDEVVDATGLALLPGLVNGHTHAAMTLFRGYADDLPLMEWLTDYIWPAEERLEAEDVYWGTRLACLEMIRAGVVRFWDMYWHPSATARAARDAGMRVVIGAPLIDGGDAAGRDELVADAERSLAELAGQGPLVEAALGPHAIYTVSPDSLRAIGEIAEREELPVEIHLSETEQEVADCLDAHGVRPAVHLDRCNLLGPKTLAAHGVWLDADELDLIAERGATLVANPVANQKLAVGGVLPYVEARRRSIPVGLGTDGAGSNNSLDILADAKSFALAQKAADGDPAAVTASETLAIATGARAPLLGGTRLESGAPADLIGVRLDDPNLALGGLAEGLVYGVGGSVVALSVIAGAVRMHGGVVGGAEDVVEATRERARHLLGS